MLNSKPSNPVNTPDAEFDLHTFFPYQVWGYYRAVSDAIAQVYNSMFDLSVSEWRVMAALSSNNVLSAGEIVTRSSMTKVNVSRAIKNLHTKGFLKRDINDADKRFAALRLTKQGKEVFSTLLPHITRVEKNMFAGFTDIEIASLLSMMERIRANAESEMSSPALK